MLDDENLRRLAEIGIDVYVTRSALQVVASEVSSASVPAIRSACAPGVRSEAVDGVPGQAPHAVIVLAEATSVGARALIANVVRALGFAGIACEHVEMHDETALAGVDALVVFGERQVRAAGALVTAQRQREIGWVAAVELSTLATDASAKRALWSELRRMARELAARATAARR